MCLDSEQNVVVSPLQVVLHVRHMPEHCERQKNPSLSGGSVELCFRGGLLGMHLKSHIS